MNNIEELKSRAQSLKMVGLLAYWDTLDQGDFDWITRLIEWEEETRQALSVDRRLARAKLGRFKPISDFDWGWPEKIDRQAIERALTHKHFLKDNSNLIFVGENGTGKTTLAKAFAWEAVMAGQTALFVSAAKMLGDLASQQSDLCLMRKIRAYCQPHLLVIDEVGYLSYSDRHADLLFDIVNRRYENKPTIITTNLPFNDWQRVFPNASCVVSLVDRLVHHSEIFLIEGESYRLKEATERSQSRQKVAGKGNKKSDSNTTEQAPLTAALSEEDRIGDK